MFERPNFDENSVGILEFVENQGSVFRGCAVYFGDSHGSRSKFRDFDENFNEIWVVLQNRPTV